jgi:hypothetical protein
MSYPHEDRERERIARPGSDTDSIWMRGLIMLLIIVCYWLAQSVLYVTTVIQFIWMAVTGEKNGLVADFGRSLGLWLAEAAWFLTGDTDEKPFPWRPWPRS